MNNITRKAYAKINLALDVLSRRPDGYHEVKMIMQTIGLYDELTFKKIPQPNTSPPIIIETNSTQIPTDETNIIYRAATAIMERFNLNTSIKINLTKNIPVAAGMAGGSTNAAAVFHGLNDLLNLNMTTNEMCEMGVKIGADVPFCILSGTALAEGIGEKLPPLPSLPPCHILIANPNISVSTKWVYENLNANALVNHPDIDGIITALHYQDLDGITSRMENVLETVTIKKHPIIKELKTQILTLGAKNTLMSGSGPTVFGIYTNESKAQNAYNKLKNDFETHLTMSVESVISKSRPLRNVVT